MKTRQTWASTGLARLTSLQKEEAKCPSLEPHKWGVDGHTVLLCGLVDSAYESYLYAKDWGIW